MHQDYDKVFKENIVKAEKTVLSAICGMPNLLLQELPRAVPRTIERRGDWLKIGIDTNTAERKLYHIEFQTADDDTMPLRMLIYWSLYRELYRLPVEQFAIYLGENPPQMPTMLQEENVWFRYRIIAINTIDYELFLNAETPEAIILAILADFKKQDNFAVVGKILSVLRDKIPNKRLLQKYIFQMELLANLRDLQPLISHQITKMSINYDLSKDFRYNQGIDIGINQGIDIGINQGIDIGINQGKAEALSLTAKIIKLYTKGFDATAIAERLKTDTKTVSTAIAEYDAEDAAL